MQSYNARAVAKNLRNLSDTINSIVSDDIKSRDRVTISLEEYIGMKESISKLSSEVNSLRNIINAFDIPINELSVIPETLHTEIIESSTRDLGTSVKCKIEFKARRIGGLFL